MPRYERIGRRSTKGDIISVRRKYTPAEEAAADNAAAILANEKPLKDWESAMLESDTTLLPRWLEDHIESDHNGITNSTDLQRRYNDKKSLRATKP